MLYLDSASLEDARQAATLPFVGGLSCNPTLLAQALGSSTVTRDALAHHLLALAQALPGPMYVQTMADAAAGMVEDAAWIRGTLGADRAIVKIPSTPEGLRAVRILADQGAATCVTAVYSVRQAYVAAASGAAWIAPYCNRITRAGGEGVFTVSDGLDCYRRHALPTRLLVASVKSVDELEALLLTGAHHVTVALQFGTGTN